MPFLCNTCVQRGVPVNYPVGDATPARTYCDHCGDHDVCFNVPSLPTRPPNAVYLLQAQELQAVAQSIQAQANALRESHEQALSLNNVARGNLNLAREHLELAVTALQTSARELEQNPPPPRVPVTVEPPLSSSWLPQTIPDPPLPTNLDLSVSEDGEALLVSPHDISHAVQQSAQYRDRLQATLTTFCDVRMQLTSAAVAHSMRRGHATCDECLRQVSIYLKKQMAAREVHGTESAAVRPTAWERLIGED